jgi:hypothetical protein
MTIADLMRDRVNIFSMYYRIAHESTAVYWEADRKFTTLD